MSEKFAAFILSHGRPDNVQTYHFLASCGYTGVIYIVCDDTDSTLPQYRQKFGSKVLVFSKEAVADHMDLGDNFPNSGRISNAVVYARNAVWGLAESLGVEYFIVLDDDYFNFSYRPLIEGKVVSRTIRNLDRVFRAMVDFLKATKASTVAMSQGGDHIGGAGLVPRLTRKAMNSFVCETARPFKFFGRLNEDVSAYITLGNRGALFFTYWLLQLEQPHTQQNAGGMTDIYLDGGTYTKSFYSVLYAPSCVRVAYNSDMRRLHHQVNWTNAVPKIINETHRKQAERLT